MEFDDLVDFIRANNASTESHNEINEQLESQ